ncbi:TetR family transcriptional regulator [Skermania piniformis]|uniref:TetR/AcrR family transcriptional regulator C-terminal domain-containing protein n=1 Tax=Skermania pinensis TaxID=39122 RepID=A0ABX8SBA9_9ACTN|nr:TetR family transcriptional regulator [Skermania piniformis]QXQ15134.1 TetR/AcrR family transcriptional regulator C-terminal domain-containing protein [Skermania piniformis]
MQLHKDDVLDGALTILDTFGLADLTMRRLATSLHVAPGALYWHFPNKQALLGALADRISARMAEPAAATGATEQVSELAHRLRDALLAHRDGAELVSASYASRHTAGLARERLIEAVLGFGLRHHEAELGGLTLLYYVLGHTVDEQAGMQLDSVGALPDGVSPLFDTPDATARFEFGLRLFVGGLISVAEPTTGARVDAPARNG